MSLILGVLLTITILMIVVFIHEMGHFLMARITGMKVEEFGIGIPPKAKRLFSDKEGTDYTLNWLPIGGFVRIRGEDPGSEDADAKDSFSSKKWWARSLVIIAGVTMNFLLAWLIFAGLIWQGSSPLSVNTLSEKSYGSYFLPSMTEALESGYIVYNGITLHPIAGGLAYNAGIGSGDTIANVTFYGFYGEKQLHTSDTYKKTRSEHLYDPGIATFSGSEITIDALIFHIRNDLKIELGLLSASTGKEYTVVLKPENGKIDAYIKYKNMRINSSYAKSYTLKDAFILGGKETLAL